MNEPMTPSPMSSPEAARTPIERVGALLGVVGSGLKHGLHWLGVESLYWSRMFYYVSRRFVRAEAAMALVALLVVFGTMLSNGMLSSANAWLETNYIVFTLVMIVFCANLLPREREEQTLEILWSQPISRNVLIVFQLLVLTLWCTILAALVMGVVGYFTLYMESFGWILLSVVTTTFAVGAITILISTFTRQTLSTLLLAVLVFGLHYAWLRPLGPLDLYTMTAIVEPERDQPGFLVNRIALAVLLGFVLDYLFRRLRRTAEWFT